MSIRPQIKWPKTKTPYGVIGLSLLILTFLLLACHGKDQEKTLQKKYVVHPEPMHKVLFFTGTIQPLTEHALTSPMDAVVESMQYHYGQPVKKDKIVFVLNSTELQKQYNDTLTEYLKAKDNYSIARAKFNGTQDLWDSGLISKNNYLSEKSSLNNSRVSLMQATRKLSEMLEKMGDGTYRDLSHLSFAEFDKVREALTGKHNLIYLRSPSNGVLLYPPKATDDKNGRITVGTSVKGGQGLAVIGDLSGIRVEIDVPEVDIDKIKPGMTATVRGVAFAKEELKGKLVAINAQATTAGANNTLPSFNAIIEVKSITPHQQALLKVGMSATIELAIDSKDKLMVPIAAIQQKQGKSYARVMSPKGLITNRLVITGPARADKVVIESGLQANDVVVYE